MGGRTRAEDSARDPRVARPATGATRPRVRVGPSNYAAPDAVSTGVRDLPNAEADRYNAYMHIEKDLILVAFLALALTASYLVRKHFLDKDKTGIASNRTVAMYSK